MRNFRLRRARLRQGVDKYGHDGDNSVHHAEIRRTRSVYAALSRGHKGSLQPRSRDIPRLLDGDLVQGTVRRKGMRARRGAGMLSRRAPRRTSRPNSRGQRRPGVAALLVTEDKNSVGEGHDDRLLGRAHPRAFLPRDNRGHRLRTLRRADEYASARPRPTKTARSAALC